MDYEKAVANAVQALTALYQAILADLDEEGGGIGWWSPQIGWKRSALLGEYLLSSCTGVTQSLTDASLAIELFAEQEYADNHWIQGRCAEVARAGNSGDSYMAAIARGPHERRRAHLIEMYRNGALSSLATALDRLHYTTRLPWLRRAGQGRSKGSQDQPRHGQTHERIEDLGG